MAFGRFTARPQEDSLVLTRGNTRLKLDPRPDVAGEVIVGVRPEHARPWNEAEGLIGPLDGSVDFIESLGRETFVGLSVADETRFIVQVPGRARVQLGDALTFGFERDMVHLFDPVSERALPGVQPLASPCYQSARD